MASNPSLPDIQSAVALLKDDKLIGMPTETVYGLAGDATNAKALAQIYAQKGRPTFNPLIIHTYSMEKITAFVTLNDHATTLARHFWPGPLTLVLPRRTHCPIDLLASAGLSTLAVRIPSHPVALELLRAFDKPLAAPSANLSNHLSPTTKAMVQKDFPGLFVLEGGASPVGLESTIIGFDDDQRPLLYRAGGTTVEDIEKVLGCALNAPKNGAIHAPGMLKKHYAPNHKLRLNAPHKEVGEVFLGFGFKSAACIDADLNLSLTGDVIEAAANLFQMIHKLDEMDATCIAVAPIPSYGLGLAINDRLTRAAS